MHNGQVTTFDGGLFYFGCMAQYFYDAELVSKEVFRIFRGNRELGMRIYSQLAAAVRAGEEEGRVVWRQTAEMSYDLLNYLLRQNGLPPYPCPEKPYLASDVEEWVKGEDISLQVIVGGYPSAG